MHRPRGKSVNNILVTWVLSYLMILILPVFSWMASFGMSRSIIQRQTDTINQGMLTLLCEAVEQRLAAAAYDMQRIATDDIVNRLIYGGVRDSQDVYRSMQVKNMLQRLVDFNSSVSSIYLYLHEEDLVISQQTVASGALFHRVNESGLGLTDAEWEALMREIHIRDYYPVGEGAGRHVVCLMSLPVSTLNRAVATLVVQFKPNAFTSLIGKTTSSEGMDVAIYYGNGALIASNTGEADSPQGDAADYIEARTTSASNGWSYVSRIPRNIYMENHNALQTFTLLALLLALAAGAGIIVFFTRKNITPIRFLVSKIENNFHVRRQDQNEYAYLNEMIGSVVDSHRNNTLLLREKDVKLRHSYMLRLLTGHADMGIPIEEYLTLLGFNYGSGSYAVLLFDFDEDMQALSGAVSDLMRSEPKSFLYGQSAEIDGRIAFLADCANMDPDSLRKAAGEFAQWLRERFCSLVMSVSTIRDSAMGISHAYEEALYSMEYLLTVGSGKEICYWDLQESAANLSYYYPPEEERRFIEHVVKADIPEAQALLNRIWEHNLRQEEGFGLTQAQLLMYNFISSVFKAAAECADPEGSLSLKTYVLPAKLHTLEEMRAEVKSALDGIQYNRAAARQNGGDDIRRRILGYICQNYADPSLSVEKICDVFGRSRSSLFALFKGIPGEGLLHHINKTRITAATQLLTRDTTDIGEIAGMVGYTSVHTFLRVFKKYEGVTPGKYREIARQISTI